MKNTGNTTIDRPQVLENPEVPYRPEVLLRLENLGIGYRQGRRLRMLNSGINCNVFRGELVSLMGRNGSGKSTLLRTLAGLQQKLYGRIMLDGKFIEEYGKKELARKMGFVSTDVIRVEGLRVKDLVAMGRFPYTGWFGSLSARDREKVEEAIEMCSLELLRNRDLDELSDGERQRAMIARTLAQDTDLLVLDEPTAFLDLVHRHEITLLLGELARDHGKTIVFSSHDLQLSLKTADRIWLIHGGGILEGAPEDMVLDGRLEEGLLEEENIRLDHFGVIDLFFRDNHFGFAGTTAGFGSVTLRLNRFFTIIDGCRFGQDNPGEDHPLPAFSSQSNFSSIEGTHYLFPPAFSITCS